MSILTKNTSKFVVFASFLFFFTGCSLPEIKEESPEINEVKKNAKFQVILPEDHTTGYIWQLNTDFDQKTLENINTVWHGNEKGVSFNFKALQPGEVTLTFVNRKYRDTLNVKRFIIKILAE